jgi:hypothetical protein
MKFPRRYIKLREIFRKAETPDISGLQGEYLVDILSFFPSLRRFSHHKVVYKEHARFSGYNILFNKKWGYFSVEKGISRDIDSNGSLIINYDREENSFLTSGIRDHIRCLEKDKLYIGRFYYVLFGRIHFIGYFSLMKIKQGNKIGD